MAEKNEKFPNGFQAFLLVVALYLAEGLVGAALHDMHDFLSMSARDLSGIVMLLANCCIFTFLMHFKELTYRDLFHSSSSSIKATLFVLLPAILLTLPALMLVISWLVAALVRVAPLSAWEVAMFEGMGSGSLSSITVACILAPVLEEMLFRGIVLRSFLRQYSRWSAILGSATLFGFAHLNLYQFAVGVVLGTFAGWLYERTRSLWPCIALHAAYNSALTVISMASIDDPGARPGTATVASWITALLVGAAGIHLLRRALLAPAKRRR
jgi:membrane protease YdiL (CAAX protease family)